MTYFHCEGSAILPDAIFSIQEIASPSRRLRLEARTDMCLLFL
jgi:hypothetical protein